MSKGSVNTASASESDCDSYDHFSDSETEVNEEYLTLEEIFDTGDVERLKEFLADRTPDSLLEMMDIGIISFGVRPDTNVEQRAYSSTACFRYLVENGLSINKRFKCFYGKTVLHLACIYDERYIPFILENGGDPNIEDNQGLTPVHMYLERESDASVLELFSKHGFDFKMVDESGRSLLWYCYLHDVGKFIRTVDFLISKGVDINSKDKEGKNFLHDKCANPDHFKEAIPLLVARGFDFISQGKSVVDVFRFLMRRGRPTNREDLKKLIRDTEEELFDIKDPGTD